MKQAFSWARRKGVAWTCLLGVVLALVSIVPASAHAIVDRTEPGIDEILKSPPDRVVMYFNEPVELEFGSIHVFDSGGERVDAGEADHLPGRPDAIEVGLQPDLAEGTYTVSWHVVSADSHPIHEAFVFHIGHRSKSVADVNDDQGGSARSSQILLGITRGVDFAVLLLLAGGLIFFAFAWRSSRRENVGVSPRAEALFLERWQRLLRWTWLAAAIATVASLPLQAAVAGQMSLGDAFTVTAVRETLDTRFGRVALLRLVLLVLLGALYLLRPKISRAKAGVPDLTGAGRSLGAASAMVGTPPQPLLITAAALTILLLVTPGLSGHAGTTSPTVLNVIVDVLHLGAAAAWVGGLAFLLFAAFPATRDEEGERTKILAPVIARYSKIAVYSVIAVVVSGLWASYIQVRSFGALTGSTYGLVLLAKVAIFLPLVGLGGFNKNYVIPRIDRAAREGDDPSGLTTLKKIVSVEVALAVVVVAVTAALVSLAPGRDDLGDAKGPFLQSIALGEGRLDVLVQPNQVGENEVHLTAVTDAGSPMKVKEMQALFTMPEQGIGPLTGEGRRLAPGHFVVQGDQLSVPGTWSVEVVARISRFEEERSTFQLTVPRR
jgi:copper transport protein